MKFFRELFLEIFGPIKESTKTPPHRRCSSISVRFMNKQIRMGNFQKNRISMRRRIEGKYPL